ncbi:MFS transporter [Vibrio sp.]|uniref:MFS transporter n=1 Tax=Vibrio sp. TaxID=678 RepID=UPI003D101BD5
MSLKNNSRFQLGIIGFTASLMGIGQNGLLVALPFLVEQSPFGLPTWSMLIAIGSFLFLPSAPFWGRFSDRHGPKKVVLQALAGMAVSFLLLALFAILSNRAESLPSVALIGLLVARIIYGCTVSGMVPAAQHWAILLCGGQNRLQAITTVSIGLSAGRLIGPLFALLALKFSPYAPLTVMMVLPGIALLGALWLPAPRLIDTNRHRHASLPWIPKQNLWPYLASGLLLCAAIALLQYSFSPLITSVTDWSTGQVSDAIGVLLTISAACTFITQLAVIRKSKLTPISMYRLGALALTVGFSLFLFSSIWLFGLAMALAAVGGALLVPAYTSAATEQQSEAPGAVAGYISMSHTLGYGLASLLAFSATLSAWYPVYLCLLFAGLILATAVWLAKSEQVQPAKLI